MGLHFIDFRKQFPTNTILVVLNHSISIMLSDTLVHAYFLYENNQNSTLIPTTKLFNFSNHPMGLLFTDFRKQLFVIEILATKVQSK